MTQPTLQLVAWFFATIECVLALYVLVLNMRHRANRHLSVLLFLFALNNIGIGIMMGAETLAQALPGVYLLAATVPALQAGVFIIALVLLKPEWIFEQRHWVGWGLYGMAVLPIALTLADVGLGTRLWYTGLDPATYAGGYVSYVAFSQGHGSLVLRVLNVYLLGLLPVVPLVYVAFFDRAITSLIRRLARLLLATQVFTIVLQFAARKILSSGEAALVISIVLIVGYAYAAFYQMVSERRAQRGRLQVRLTALIVVITLPLFLAVSAMVNARLMTLLRRTLAEEAAVMQAAAMKQAAAMMQTDAIVWAVARPIQMLSLGIGGVSVVALMLLTWFAVRQVFQPIRALTETAHAIRSGDLTRVAAVEGEDELGTLAHAFNAMTDQLRQMLQQEEARAAELEHEIAERQRLEAERERLQQEIIDAQRQTLKALSTPVIPVMDRILVMPLIGSIDRMRAKDIMRALLASISAHRAEFVILDVTGVPVMDTSIVNHLNKAIQAARLKGARVIVTGISDAVAESIVDGDGTSHGIDWGAVETLADLQTGLRVALNRMDIHLKKGNEERETYVN